MSWGLVRGGELQAARHGAGMDAGKSITLLNNLF